jgi:DmsE family decaheme c-type cytochrome
MNLAKVEDRGEIVRMRSRWLGRGLPIPVVCTFGLFFVGCLCSSAKAQAKFEHSAHAVAQVGCEKCHLMEEGKVKGKGSELKLATPQLCFSCHSEVEAEFAQASNHKNKAGVAECRDCHEPHGVAEEKGKTRTANEIKICVQCHKEQAGPFAYDHAAVKAEGCTGCHQPHGGANPKLLKRSTVNALCTECHMPALKIKGRAVQGHVLNAQSAACTSCHTDVHGSQSSEAFFNTAQQ